jgi:hypothetical protein
VLATHNVPPPRAWRLGACALATLVLAACGGGGSDGGSASGLQSLSSKGEGPLEIRTVNNRADLVSGGDALIEVNGPPGQVKSGSVKVTRNGVDVTSAFTVTEKGTLVGLVTGLVNGANTIEATFRNGPTAALAVTNAPRSGPVLSGALIKPFYCATPVPVPGDGVTTPNTNASGLSGQPDANCNIATEYTVYFRKAAAPANCSTALPNPVPSATSCWGLWTAATPASEIASTTTDHGVTVPFIVRLERGTMNRGIYDLAVLFKPTTGWTALQAQPQWNGKIYFTFGASTGQPRRQARPATNWSTQELQLSRGFLVVQNSMTDSSRNSNRVLMSETVMMMKEHIADNYGVIKYTLGNGCSGGSINSNMNASINPGLLDGVITTCTYPDSETTSMEVGDCTLLVEAYQRPELLALWAGRPQSEINIKKGAINGHPDQSGCQAWYNAFGSNGKAGVYNQRVVGAIGSAPQRVADWDTGAIRTVPFATNNCELPNTAVYDPANPSGTANLPRCNAWSWGESIWGKSPNGIAANDTRDNVGVQYGLGALMAGKIGLEEFVTVNEVIGGNDRDSTPRAGRTTADQVALETAYRAGIVASGKQLAKTAIIDMRGWDDSNITVPPGQTPFGVNAAGTNVVGNTIPIHHQWYSWAVRDRITRDYGDAGNQALWRFANTGLGPMPWMSLEALNTMDQWLTTLVADTSTAAIEQKVRASRPQSSTDFCLLTTDAAQTTKVFDTATCDADPFLKPAASPRQVAGGPRAEDVLKCQLKPLNRADYVGITDAQYARLGLAFPDGVCDWSRPGVGQQLAVSPLTFKAGPGGQSLPAAPVSAKK